MVNGSLLPLIQSNHYKATIIPSPPPPPPSSPAKMLLSLLLVLLLPPASSANATCPYDIPRASQMMPAPCFANATEPSVTSCCWYVFAAYLLAGIRYGNLTGAAFLPPANASACSAAFSSYLLSHGLARPSLLSANSCNLAGYPVSLSAGNRPCQFSSISQVRSDADLSPADRLCAGPLPDLSLDPDSHPETCSSCQTAVINTTFSLLNSTGSKEVVPCGMAATLGLWAPHNPSLPRFRSFALCMLQVLQNIGGLGTADILPSPPPSPAASFTDSASSSSSSSSRSTKIVAGCAVAGGLSFLGTVVFLLFLVRRLKRRRRFLSGEIADAGEDNDNGVVISPVLPTEGLYIFTKAELKQATDGYDDRLLLGKGGAGKVYLGKLPSGHRVAIKRIYRDKKLSEFYREVEMLAKLRHRHLTTLVGYCRGDRREHALVYEYMAGGNLAGALAGACGIPWRSRLRIAAEVAEGLTYLHEFPGGAVVHRDVKPTNVLLTENVTAKLSDFGVSRIMPAEGTHISTEVRGTMGYVDPESFSVGHVSEAADVYSFGVVLLELVTGMKAVVPTPTGGAESIVHAARAAVSSAADVGAVVDRRLGPAWDRPSVEAVFELARRCVRPYKEQRPAMGEVLVLLKAVMSDLDARVGGGGGGSSAEVGDSTPPATAEDLSVPSSPTTEQPWSSGSDRTDYGGVHRILYRGT